MDVTGRGAHRQETARTRNEVRIHGDQKDRQEEPVRAEEEAVKKAEVMEGTEGGVREPRFIL